MSSAATTTPGKPNIFVANRPKKKQPPFTKITDATSQREKTKNTKSVKNSVKTVLSEKPESVNIANVTKLQRKSRPMIVNNDSLQIKILPKSEYEGIKDELMKLNELNFVQSNRINELEHESNKVMQEFGALYEENALLRKKLDTGNEPIAEPYSRVFGDRKILRDSEIGYKKRIRRFEQELIEWYKEIETLESDLKLIKSKLLKYKDKPGHEKIIDVLNTQIQDLKIENQKLKDDISELKGDKPLNTLSKKTQDQNRHSLRRDEPSQVSYTQKKATFTRQPMKTKPSGHDNGDGISRKNKTPVRHFEYEYYLPDADLYDW